MNDSEAVVRTTLRIPGKWQHPRELIQRMPDDVRLTPDSMILADGSEIEFTPMPPDDQFAQIFKSSCRQPATEEEMEIVANYTVNVGLTGPGGSMEAALTMLQAGAAVVRAGGAGVFIDNCALAHGGSHWIEMADDGGPDAVSFAYAAIVRGEQEVWTMGMHVMGLPDVVMGHADLDADGETIIEVIRYLCRGEKPMGDGHVLADEAGPRFLAEATSSDKFAEGSPMYNPFGRLKLVSVKDVADRN